MTATPENNFDRETPREFGAGADSRFPGGGTFRISDFGLRIFPSVSLNFNAQNL